MFSIFPTFPDDFDDEEEMNPLWRENGYFDDVEWVITYQRNQYSPIEDVFIGNKQEAIEIYDKFIEDWG